MTYLGTIRHILLSQSPSNSPTQIDWSGVNDAPLGSGGGWEGALLALLGLIVIIAALVLVSRFLAGHNFSAGKNSRMCVVERVALGRDSYLAIVQAAGKHLLIGVSKDRVELICELGPDSGYSITEETQAGQSFLKRFVGNLKSTSGFAPANPPEQVTDPPKTDFKSVLDESSARISNPDTQQDAKTDYNAAIESMKRYGNSVSSDVPRAESGSNGGFSRFVGETQFDGDNIPETTKTMPDDRMDEVMRSLDIRKERYASRNRRKG